MNITGLGNILYGIGLFACIGTILLAVLALMIFRVVTGSRNQTDQNVWNRQDEARSRRDDPNIESQGGFGGIPTTGQFEEQDEADSGSTPRYSADIHDNSGFVDPDNPPSRQHKDD